jgi:uncharacterized membrane protein
MSLDRATLGVILLMALVTYGTRVAGLFLVGRLRLAGRGKAAFDAIPAAVLTALIAPAVLTSGSAEAIAAVITVIAALRLPLFATVVIGVAAVVMLRLMITP